MFAAILFTALSLLGQTPDGPLSIYPLDRSQAHASIRRLRGIEKAGGLNVTQRIELAMNYHAAGQHLLFRSILEEGRRLHPEEPEIPFLLGRHYGSDVQDWAKAAACFRAALALRRDGRTLSYLANALETEGHMADALPLYQEAIQLSPCQPLALTGLARLRQVSTSTLLACQPRDPYLLLELAKLLVAEGRQGDALRALQKAVIAAPRDPAILYRLYRLYQETGDGEKASGTLERYRALRAIYGNQ